MEIEIQTKVDELERYKKATVERELRMMEFKEELKTLKKGSSGANNGD